MRGSESNLKGSRPKTKALVMRSYEEQEYFPGPQPADYQRIFRQGKRKVLFGGVKASSKCAYPECTERQRRSQAKMNRFNRMLGVPVQHLMLTASTPPAIASGPRSIR